MKSHNAVKDMLEKYLGAREDDNDLLWFYALNRGYSKDVLNFINQEKHFLKNHIRIRAKLQREGKYLASPEVQKKRARHRKIKANEMRTPLVVNTNLTERQLSDIKRQGMYLPVTEVTGSKVEEKEIKTGFFSGLLGKIGLK